ncbi:MAG: hypothetical protein M3263_01700 [Thermoproteota archaeon]|nr:hypothetical protein [Thermoproteota archaeon]
MKNAKSKMQSLHTAIAVVMVSFATACWGLMAYLPAITDVSQAYAQEAEQQPVPPSSSPSTNTPAGEVNATNNQTEAIGVPLQDPLVTNATTLNGEIGSIQGAQEQLFAWSTAGDWVMQLDGPLIGRAEPQVQSFNATIHMVRLDGNVLHEHEISNFTQHSVSHTGDAITTLNGTFSVSMREGIVNDVPGYIQFTGDLVSIWLNPTALENHFGPTPIQGMVLPQTERGEAMGSH